jgi:hypothetical protein
MKRETSQELNLHLPLRERFSIHLVTRVVALGSYTPEMTR